MRDARDWREREGRERSEIWEISYHTNPDAKALRGSLILATASADRTIKFYTFYQNSDTGDVQL